LRPGFGFQAVQTAQSAAPVRSHKLPFDSSSDSGSDIRSPYMDPTTTRAPRVVDARDVTSKSHATSPLRAPEPNSKLCPLSAGTPIDHDDSSPTLRHAVALHASLLAHDDCDDAPKIKLAKDDNATDARARGAKMGTFQPLPTPGVTSKVSEIKDRMTASASTQMTTDSTHQQVWGTGTHVRLSPGALELLRDTKRRQREEHSPTSPDRNPLLCEQALKLPFQSPLEAQTAAENCGTSSPPTCEHQHLPLEHTAPVMSGGPQAILARAATRSARAAEQRAAQICAACLDKERELEASMTKIDELRKANVRLQVITVPCAARVLLYWVHFCDRFACESCLSTRTMMQLVLVNSYNDAARVNSYIIVNSHNDAACQLVQ
jgi:hypothetical protein